MYDNVILMPLDQDLHLLSEHTRTPSHASLLLQRLSSSAKGKKQQMELSKGIQIGASPKPLPSIIIVLT